MGRFLGWFFSRNFLAIAGVMTLVSLVILGAAAMLFLFMGEKLSGERKVRTKCEPSRGDDGNT
jgi:hypothetical protein